MTRRKREPPVRELPYVITYTIPDGVRTIRIEIGVTGGEGSGGGGGSGGYAGGCCVLAYDAAAQGGGGGGGYERRQSVGRSGGGVDPLTIRHTTAKP